MATAGDAALAVEKSGIDGRDRLKGYGGDDTLRGLGEGDVLEGYSGDDLLDGGPGRDKLSGMLGTDVLRGGPDRDTVYGGGGDKLSGGLGDDYILADDGTERVTKSTTIDCGDGRDEVVADKEDKIADGCETVKRY